MRDIKFRAWDKEKQFMFSPTQIEIAQGENFNKWDKWRPMAWRDELPEKGSGGIGRALGDECELMQYTGLKDINGKEIYEGDIVQQNYKFAYNQNQAFMGEVLYSDCVFWLKNDDECTFLYDEYGIYNSEVIGNIYENPQLVSKI